MDNAVMTSAAADTLMADPPTGTTDGNPTAPSTEAVAENAIKGDFGAIEVLLARLPQEIRGQFTDLQLAALRDAAKSLQWSNHPVDIRMSIPLLFKRFYIVFIGGAERRDKERRKYERRRHPLLKLGNSLALTAACLTAMYFAGFFMYSGYISFMVNYIQGPF